jgi:hypothetical protein
VTLDHLCKFSTRNRRKGRSEKDKKKNSFFERSKTTFVSRFVDVNLVREIVFSSSREPTFRVSEATKTSWLQGQSQCVSELIFFSLTVRGKKTVNIDSM